MFRQFVLLRRQMDLFGRELLAVDGTRIKAVNNKDRNFTRDSLEKFIRAADEGWTNTCGGLTKRMSRKPERGARIKNLTEKIEALRKKRGLREMLARLEQSGENQISLTDPDSGRWRHTPKSASGTTCRSRSMQSTR